MKILLTGNTGFKGSWLTLMLRYLGHEVFGYSLSPEERSLFIQAEASGSLAYDLRGDIRDAKKLNRYVRKISPDFIIHLAAQPLVLESYRIPHETFSINTEGTNNILYAARECQNLRGILVITTDKVYAESKQRNRFNEGDPLGGKDPYSASKSAADLLTQSIAISSMDAPIGIARAGNVIGGGDWSKDRLFPDIARAMSDKKSVVIRYPNAIRPWQHVFDCLNGYIEFMNHLVTSSPRLEILNFGPSAQEKWSVIEIVNFINQNLLDGALNIEVIDSQNHEAEYLELDSAKASKLLNWTNFMDTQEAVNTTINWYQKEASGFDMKLESSDNVSSFFKTKTTN